MKYLSLLPFAAFSTAFVVPNEQVFNELAVETNNRQAKIVEDAAWTKDDILDAFKSHYSEVSTTVKHASEQASDKFKNALDDALSFTSEAGSSMSDTAFDAQAWMQTNVDHVYDLLEENGGDVEEPPHHAPSKDKKDKKDKKGKKDKKDKKPHHGPHKGKKPHHAPHHGKPNLTVYELISKSKYTTKLAKLIDEFPDFVDALNGTEANFTLFAPTDKAFEKIPEHAPKPTKEQLKALLSYHISPDFFPAGRVLSTHTIPTLLKGEHLSDTKEPQRLSVNIGLKGLTLNFYSRVVAIDIFGTNGVIHGVDSLLLPPPNVIKIIDLLPTEFSTLELGLGKTGLLETLNSTDHPGGTFFAPSNFAFAKLGPRINAFLFSTYGQKYLKALLLYHVVPKTTLYSDAVYQAKKDSDNSTQVAPCHGDKKTRNVPKGYFHYELPTMLDDRSIGVDIARYGGFISMKVNGFSRVTVQDGIAEDGVIQVVSDVLIPPKNAAAKKSEGGWFKKAVGKFTGERQEEMTVEEFMSRFEGHVEED